MYKTMKRKVLAMVFALLPAVLGFGQTGGGVSQLPAVGTTVTLGKVDNITIEGKVQSPASQATPLQVVCVFEYTEGDIFKSPPALPPAANGLFHLDQALHGLITDLRKSGKFMGRALETLLITPPAGTIPAKKLLLIGLGDRNKFSPELMIDIGRVGMREALRLGVSGYSHGSDLKDAGIDSPTGVVAANVVKGAIEAYETEMYLRGKGAGSRGAVTKLTMLAGAAFLAPSGDAIKAFINSRH